MSSEVPASSLARCAIHPELIAAGTCSRCGGFACADCLTAVSGLEGRMFCAACAARPEVNYLEAFRLEYWGRRDVWAWTVGLVTVGVCALVALLLLGGPRSPREGLAALLLLASVPVGVAFFLGRPWARTALMLTPWGLALIAGALAPEVRIVPLLIGTSPFALIAIRIHRDVRNQLFFRRPVTPGQLKALWNVRRNNPFARQALSFGLSGVLVPVFAPLAVLFGAVALRRVDPQAHPPIGRGGQALAGLVLGVASLLLWGFVLLPFLGRFLSGMDFHGP